MARVEHLFIVRTWREQDAYPEVGQWRGSVEHMTSGQRRYFTSFSDLTAFIIQSQMARPSPTPPLTDEEDGQGSEDTSLPLIARMKGA